MKTKSLHWLAIGCLLALAACGTNAPGSAEDLGQAWLEAYLADDCAKLESFFVPGSAAQEEFSSGCILTGRLLGYQVDSMTYQPFPDKDYGAIYFTGVFHWSKPGGEYVTTNDYALVVHEEGGGWYAGGR